MTRPTTTPLDSLLLSARPTPTPSHTPTDANVALAPSRRGGGGCSGGCNMVPLPTYYIVVLSERVAAVHRAVCIGDGDRDGDSEAMTTMGRRVGMEGRQAARRRRAEPGLWTSSVAVFADDARRWVFHCVETTGRRLMGARARVCACVGSAGNRHLSYFSGGCGETGSVAVIRGRGGGGGEAAANEQRRPYGGTRRRNAGGSQKRGMRKRVQRRARTRTGRLRVH